jgi:hypothetical protein
MTMFSIFSTYAPVFLAIWLVARSWSNLDIAVKFFLEMLGAYVEQIRALVLAGLPTTRTLTVFLA